MNPETLAKLQSAASQPGKAGKEARQVLEAMGLPVASPRAPVKVPVPEQAAPEPAAPEPEQDAPEQAAPAIKVQPRASAKVARVVKAPERAAPTGDVPAWLVRLVLGSRAAYASVRRAVLVACVVVLVIVALTSIPLWAMLLSRY